MAIFLTPAATAPNLDIAIVLDKDFNPVFENAKIMKIGVKEPSKPMEHPVENGTIITDHRIILPIEIDMQLILPAPLYRNLYLQIKQLFTKSSLLIVQTKNEVYKNMMISDLPHEERPEMYDAIIVDLKFKQVLFAQTEVGFSPEDAEKSDTVENGEQQQKPFYDANAQQQTKLAEFVQ